MLPNRLGSIHRPYASSRRNRRVLDDQDGAALAFDMDRIGRRGRLGGARSEEDRCKAQGEKCHDGRFRTAMLRNASQSQREPSVAVPRRPTHERKGAALNGRPSPAQSTRVGAVTE